MASTYLTRTPSSAGNRRTWTWSAWIKKSTIAVSPAVTLFGAKDGGYPEILYFASDDTLVWQHDISGSDYLLTISNKVFRDTNAWYHIVLTKDTTQSTEANRVKIYINGEQQTLTESQLGFPGQNYEGAVNNNVTHTIGNWEGNSYYFDGSMSHIHFIDGTAYDASAFGETDATTGEWKIKTDVSVTYGTNGFFILKDGNSVTDASPNTNNFTVGGGTLTKTEDCPSNVFATGNNLATYWTAATFANGNTTQTTQSNNYAFNTSTLGFKTGKFYWEAKIVSSAQSDMFGITGRTNAGGTTHELGKYADQYAFNSYSGVSRTNSTDTSYASQFNSNGTIVQIAVDMTNLKIHLGVNGVWQNSSNPSNNTGGLAIGAISTTTDGYYFVGIGDYSNGAGTHSYNFGNGYFGTTAVSSAGTNASGNGIFEYDVPTGYTALSTKGLNL
jgi:hypothetical protein